MNRFAALADITARGTGPLAFMHVHGGVREYFRLSSGPVFYHFTFVIVNREGNWGSGLLPITGNWAVR